MITIEFFKNIFNSTSYVLKVFESFTPHHQNIII